MRSLIITSCAALLLASVTPAAQRDVPAPLMPKGIADWAFDGNGTWALHGPVLALEKAGVPGGPIRRPAGVAIFKSEPLTDFTMQVEMRSTAPVDLAVRDVILIADYQSPSQFYYVHMAGKTDTVHNGVFLVNHADRKRLDTPGGTAHMTDQAWHRMRLERDTTSGSIKVYFDDLKAPILQATDKTLLSGRVGVGSFDETGEFRGLQVRRMN